MNPYTQTYPPSVALAQGFIRRVYNWMAGGLSLTALVSWTVLNNEQFMGLLLSSRFAMFGLFIGQIFLVMYLSGRIPSMPIGQATFLFFFYSGLNGVALAPLLYFYTKGSLASVFFIAAGMFTATSLYGYTTKKNLSGIGGYLMMGLMGAVIASLVNAFLIRSGGMDWILSLVFVGLAVGITAYQTQKLKAMSQGMPGDEDTQTRGAIYGAFGLYLTFVMLFVHLLFLFGDRR